MSNSITNLQTHSSNALHNAIMEAGSKDRPPHSFATGKQDGGKKKIITSSAPTYDPEPATVTEDEEMSKGGGRAVNVAGDRENVGDPNITIRFMDICIDELQDDQDGNDNLESKQRNVSLLASLIQKLKL
ncbi:hypothetical protein Tco_0143614 [Tanacetum coccineum]